jgi:hypothetical protein
MAECDMQELHSSYVDVADAGRSGLISCRVCESIFDKDVIKSVTR